jgi:hypothetical protein
MKDDYRFGLISRRDAIGLIATTPALGADATLTSIFGGTALAGASVLGATAAQACAGAPRHLSQLNAEHFEALVGETFTVGDAVATLRDVRRGPQTLPGFRQQFAMIFEAPQNLSLASDIASVAHPAIGRYDLFVTAASDGAERKTVAICFS